MSVALTQTLYRALTLYEEGKRSDNTEMLHEAETLCDAVVALDPENADAWQIAGLVRLAQGASDAAKSAFVEAIALTPDIVANHVNLATAHMQLGETEAALRVLLQAIELQKDYPEAYYNLGNTLVAAGRMEDAEEAFKKAIALKPAYPEALNNLGQRLRHRGDKEGAIRLFQQAIEYDQGYGPPWTNLCATWTDIQRFVDAIEAGRQAVHLAPENPGAHYALGNAFARARMPAEASQCFRRAIELDPKYGEAYVNLGAMQLDLGDFDGALLHFDQALSLDGEDAQAHWNKALALLYAGRFEEAWPLGEWRWQAVAGLEKPEIVEPLWDGSEGNGTILLYCEQAFGDAIQFVRFLPLVRRRGWRIVLECPPKLVRLFADSGLADLVVASGQERPAFDCWLPTMSLPGIFGTTVETIPAEIPYLVAKRKSIDDRILELDEKNLKVGIVWQGSLTNKRGLIRTCRLADFAPLRDIEGVSLFSLQSELSESDAAMLKEYGIPDLETGHRDFADTATVVRKLDLVITVDTAMVHLAGALGCRVWALLPVYPDWRWMRDRVDSPWYPNLRLFRQPARGDWASVIEQVRHELEHLSRERRIRTTDTMTKKPIPVMRPRLPNAEALRPYLEAIDKSGWYSNYGPLERQLEKRLAENFKLPATGVVCVANCTVGLSLALMSVATGRGGYCILPSFTFVASAHAVLAAGLRPYFIDVEPNSWSISTEQASAAIAAADGEVAAVMAVSPFGAPLDPSVWDAFAAESGIPVVIDAAGGFDSVVPGRSPTVVSMHATKVLPAGEGGFVLSTDTQLIRSISARSNFGFVAERRSNVAGFNGKLSEYGAAVALASLDEWPDLRRRYREVTDLYAEALGSIEGVDGAPGFDDGWVGSTCNIHFDRPIAEKAMGYLSEAGIDTRQWWGRGCHRERAFESFPSTALPATDALVSRVLGLPFHVGLDRSEIKRIRDAVAAAAKLPE